ncbi:hypothetical protein ACQKJ1_05310 [Methylorubrum rhodesianum]|uniref:hypothetical protein n=1 Tax=Methylorubrum rhodesianum TaxID=29427 RepID=UPI003D049A09
MSDPTLIADLVRAGLDPELLQRVAMELARGQAAMAAAAKVEADRIAKAEASAEAKRVANADRQRRFRDRHNASNALQAVTERDGALLPPPKINNSTPHPELHPADPDGSAAPTKVRKARKRALPADWQPGDRSERVRVELGRTTEWMRRTAVEMRTWAESKGEVRADWDATHDGWMRREANRECSRPEPPPGGARASPPGQRISGLTQHAHQKFHERRRGGDDDRTLDMEAQSASDRRRDVAGNASGRAGSARRDGEGDEGGGAGTVFDFPRGRAYG